MRFSSDLARAMQDHAEACAPEECVGALLGVADEAVVALPLLNCAATPTRAFEVSARGYLAAEREAERRGLRLLGFFHSHVDAPPFPSASDLRQAAHFAGGVVVPVKKGKAGAPVVFHGGR